MIRKLVIFNELTCSPLLFQLLRLRIFCVKSFVFLKGIGEVVPVLN
jgi:hypothetical protein